MMNQPSFSNFFVFAGPCVIEDYDTCLTIARTASNVCRKLGVTYVFKASFDKANRTALNSFRGPGMEKGLEVLDSIRRELGIPVLTDVHDVSQVGPVAEVVDVLQIPAFLCRQTDLLVAAGRTGKPVNVKKGQFMAASAMKGAVQKVRSTGNDSVLLTERGTTFGYGDLVVDMRSIPAMKQLGCPVIIDATHSVQRPSALGDRSGGNREMAPVLAKCALAAGADGLFVETHPDPDNALSDAANSISLDSFESLVSKLYGLYRHINGAEV